MRHKAAALLVAPLLTLAAPARAQPAARGYDYNYMAVCMFAELMSGYALPPIDARLLRDRRLHRLPDRPLSSSRGTGFEQNYTFKGDGVAGTLLRDGKSGDAFFQTFRVDARRIPGRLQSRQMLLDLLEAPRGPGSAPDFSQGCEQWSVSIHFRGDVLQWVEISNARLSYD